MKRENLYKLSVVILFGAGLLVFSGCTKIATNTQADNTNGTNAITPIPGIAEVQIKQNADKDLAIAKAKELWRARAIMGEDLSNGPCLSNKLIPDWVADIAHNPRIAVDNDPANQCSSYRDGTAKHFVELDPEGNVLRAE